MGWEGRKEGREGRRKEGREKREEGRKKKEVTKKQGKEQDGRKKGLQKEGTGRGRKEGRRKKVIIQMSVESVTLDTFIISRSFNTSDNMKYYYILFQVMDMKLKVDK